MKKTVLVFGLISGALSAGMMLATLPFMTPEYMRHGEVIGYTAILLAALLVFFGVRSYRENVGGGKISFGRGFAIGILITVISCVCYTATWELLYFKFMPGLGDRVLACMIERAKISGKTAEQVAETVRQTEHLKELWARPMVNAAMTFVEPFPVGLLVTALSAVILRRK